MADKDKDELVYMVEPAAIFDPEAGAFVTPDPAVGYPRSHPMVEAAPEHFKPASEAQQVREAKRNQSEVRVDQVEDQQTDEDKSEDDNQAEARVVADEHEPNGETIEAGPIERATQAPGEKRGVGRPRKSES